MAQKKLYIDITSFYNTNFLSGIQRVVIEVVVRLLKMSEFDVVLFTWKHEEKNLLVLSNSDFLKCFDECNITKSQIKIFKTLCLDSIERESILFEIDSTWDGRCHKRIEVYPSLAARGVLIVSYIYDVLPITNPEFWPTPIPLFYEYIAANLRHASSLITSVNETVKRLSNIAEKANVTLPPCTVSWLGSDFKKNAGGGKVSEKAKKIASKGKYLLCVGTLEPRKNHKVVLDVYDEKLASLGLNLVFAGRRAEGLDDLLSRIDKHQKKDNGFFFLEGENDETIDYLYENAWAVVFPTFDEGFGLPLVEALLHGAVCVTSDIPVMREVGGESSDYFDPKSRESLLKIIEGYITNEESYEEAKKRAKRYRPILWDEVVEKIKDTLLSTTDKNEEKYMKDVPVERIINEIRADIAKKSYNANNILFSDIKIDNPEVFNQELFTTALAQVGANWSVDMYCSVSGGKIKRFIKRAIRKFVRPSFFGTMKKQECFNMNTAICLNEMTKNIRDLEARIKELGEKIGEK